MRIYSSIFFPAFVLCLHLQECSPPTPSVFILFTLSLLSFSFFLLHGKKGFVILPKSLVKIGITKNFVTTTKCLVLSTKRLVALAKFLVAATKNLSVVPNFVAVTKSFFPRIICGWKKD